MPEAPTPAPVRMIDTDIALVTMPARISAADEPGLLAALSPVKGAATEALVLDFSRLEEMDSGGLAGLIVFLTKAQRQTRRLLAFGVSAHSQGIFSLAGLLQAMTVYPSEAAAVAAATRVATIAAAPSLPLPTVHSMDLWAPPTTRLSVTHHPAGAVNLNADGRLATGPLHGFGPLLRKTYSVRLSGSTETPAAVVSIWKREFAGFWPKGNGFYGTHDVITPGDTGLLNLTLLGPLKLYTGILVLYAGETSFTFLTCQGHMFGGLITFSAYRDEHGVTVAQVQPLIRPSDPFYDLTLRLGAGAIEDRFWRQSLANLAARFGVTAVAQQESARIDSRMQWQKAPNIWYNAAIRTTFYQLAAPLRSLRRLVSR